MLTESAAANRFGSVMVYLWIKAFHIIAVISWMAGLLYLPRLMVYHCSAQPGSRQSETFKVMERRLLKAIMGPAMVAAWVLGLILAWMGDFWLDLWFMAKILALVGLTGCHLLFARWVAEFAADRNTRSAKVYRIANEVPTLLMIAIVVLAVLKPT